MPCNDSEFLIDWFMAQNNERRKLMIDTSDAYQDLEDSIVGGIEPFAYQQLEDYIIHESPKYGPAWKPNIIDRSLNNSEPIISINPDAASIFNLEDVFRGVACKSK